MKTTAKKRYYVAPCGTIVITSGNINIVNGKEISASDYKQIKNISSLLTEAQ